MQGQGQPHGAFELPTISEAVHAGGDDRSRIAGLSGCMFLPFCSCDFAFAVLGLVSSVLSQEIG